MSVKAMNWAMEQATGDPRSQCLLYVIADCAGPEGIAWPSVKYMAVKSQQSKATVQRRLKELEDIGAIARFPRWEDEDGKLNSEGRGRRTSDEIRLLLERRIDQQSDESEDTDSPSQADTPPSQADTPPSQADTPPSHCSDGPPSHCSDPHMNRYSEPKKDSPPNPPPGGCAEEQSVLVEGWPEFQAAFEADKEPIVRLSIARQVFAALKPDERTRATKAAKGLIAWRERQKKPPAKPSAQTFLREIDAWPGWERHAPVPASTDPPVFVAEGSSEWDAMRVLALIRDEPPPVARMVSGHGPGLMRARPLTPAQRALAQFIASDPASWTLVKDGSQPCGAWAAFAQAEPQLIATGETKRMQIGSQVFNNWPVKVRGLRVPCAWPPRKDGSLCEAGVEARAGPGAAAA